MSSTETVSFTVRMPKAMVGELDRIAKREMSSRNREVLVACRVHIDTEKRRGK